METRKPNLTIKQPPKPEDDNNTKKSDAQPINDANNSRHLLGPDLLWEEIK